MQRVDKLVLMANQIAKHLAIHGEERAIAETADHIGKFWEPRMRVAIFDHLAAGGVGLDPLARKAIEVLGAPKSLEQQRS